MERKFLHLRANIVQVVIASGILIIFCIMCFRANTAYAVSSSTLVSLQTPLSKEISRPAVQIAPTGTPALSVSSSSVSQSSTWDASTYISLAGVIVQALAFIAVIKYVRDTAKMASATQEAAVATKKSAEAAENTVQEMKEAREEENAPFVVVYFDHFQTMHSLYLVVENIGKSVARDIKLEFTPPLQVSQANKDRIAKNSLLKDGIKSLVPNYKIPIPFDFLTHYFKANLPLEYIVKVTYFGNPSLPQIVLEYPLDLSHFNYIHFQTGAGLSQINTTLERFALDMSQHLTEFRSIPRDLTDIANALHRGVMAQFSPRADGNTIDILAKLREFEILWIVDYRKDQGVRRSTLFDLRTRCLLLKDEILIGIAASEPHSWIEEVKSIAVKMSQLGNMVLFHDAYILASSLQGHPIEDFNDLGDSIVKDIKEVMAQINNENNASLASNENTSGSASLVEEEDEKQSSSEMQQ